MKHHRYRYIRLLERFYIHLIHVSKLPIDNPASLAARGGVGLGNNDRTQFLSAPQWTAISEYIARRGEEKEEKGEKQKSSRHWSSFSEWREARDKALAAVMLFGAVRVEEIGFPLSVNCITMDGGHLDVPSTGRIPYHQAIFLPEGQPSLTAWLDHRRRAGIPGTVLFPSNDLGEPMHAASVYRRVRLVIENALTSAGLPLPKARMSPQTLRNTYAGILIDRGHVDRVIMESMGIKKLFSIGRIRESYEIARRKP